MLAAPKIRTPASPDLERKFINLFQSGKLVQVHVSKWSMTVAASKADLGLTAEVAAKTKIPDMVTLGKKALFTDDIRMVFSQIEGKARRYLLANSHRFPVADAHFVPQKILVTVVTELEKMREKYMTEVEKFVSNYEAYKQKMFETYPDYRSLLEPYYPKVEEVRGKFDFSISMYEVSFPKNIKKISAADIVTQNIAIEQAREKYDNIMREQYDHHLTQMKGFLQETLAGMREGIVQTFEVIAQKLQSREVISVPNLKAVHNAIEAFDALDFIDDTKVKAHLKTVKELLGTNSTFDVGTGPRQRLGIAVTQVLEVAKNMSDIDDVTGLYMRNLDV